MTDYEQTFQEFWKDIVCPNGEWDLEQVKKELHDYRFVMQSAAVVYDHATGGRTGNIMVHSELVKSLIDDHVTDLVREAVEDEKEVSGI